MVRTKTKTVNITSIQRERFLRRLIDETGSYFRVKAEPVRIGITTKPTLVPPTDEELRYLGRFASYRMVPEGTILCDGKTPLSLDVFMLAYMQYYDEEGKAVEGLYVPRYVVKAMRNPYGKPVYATDKDGSVVDEGDKDCFLTLSVRTPERGLTIYSEEEFREAFVPLHQAPVKKIR